jgi:transposase
MEDWLIDIGIKTIEMESIGVYWTAAFEVLESRGINSQHWLLVQGSWI